MYRKMIKTTSNNNNNNNILTFTNSCSSNNKKIKMETSSSIIKHQLTTMPETPSETSSVAIIAKDSIKTERRLSATSESSVEPMDLGRTPTPPPPPPPPYSSTSLLSSKKQLYKSKSQNDDENYERHQQQQQQHNKINKDSTNALQLQLQQTTPIRRRTRSYSQNINSEIKYESDENDFDSNLEQQLNHKSKNFDTKKLRHNQNNSNINYSNNSIKNNSNNNNRYNNNINNNRYNHHHYRHNNRTVVEIESSDNPNSLRKKFRITTTPNQNNNNNNNNLPLDNKNKYCTNAADEDEEVDDDDDDDDDDDNDANEHCNENNNADKRKFKTNSFNIYNNSNKINEKEPNNFPTIVKNDLSTTPTSSKSSSRRASNENDDADDDDDHCSNGSNNGARSGDDEDGNNRTNENESGFVDGSSHNLINSINSISSPESNGGSGPGSNGSGGSRPNTNNINSERNSGNNGGAGNSSSNEDVKYVCPICEVVSATPHEFTNHIRSHNYSSGDTENFTCRICSKVLSSASSLDRHVLVHTGERPFNCKYCHLTFTTNGNMHRHMRTHKQHPHQKRRSSNNNNNLTKNNNKDSNNLRTNSNNNNNNNNSNVNINLINNLNSTIGKSNISSNSNNYNNNNNNSTILQPLNNNNNITTANTNTATITQNGNNNNNMIAVIGDGGESYESEEDGGCSTDSSASNNSSNCKITNNNNNGINTATTNTNNQIATNITINNNNNNYKRKKSSDDDMNGIIKKRIKTINNNTIITENNTVNDFITTTTQNTTECNDQQTSDTLQQQQQQQQHQKFSCPVCNRNDFINMLTLSTHMDREHSDIPAKCRQCDVVFKTHKQLNAHRCCLTKQQPPPPPSPQPSSSLQQLQQQQQINIMQGFKDLTFVDFSSEKFPLIAKSLCEQNIRQSITNPKFECTKCYLAFPCANSLEIHIKDCNNNSTNSNTIVEKKLKPIPQLIDPQALILSNMLMQHPSAAAAGAVTELPKDFSLRKIFSMQQLIQQHQQEKNQKITSKIDTPSEIPQQQSVTINVDTNAIEQLSPSQLKRSLSSESINSTKDMHNNSSNNNKTYEIDCNRDEFFAHLDLKNKSIMSLNSSKNNNNNNISIKNAKLTSEKILSFKSLDLNNRRSLSPTPTAELNKTNLRKMEAEHQQQKEKREQKLQQQLQQNDSSRDLADIQSILNVTSASSSNFLRNFEANVNAPMNSSECGYGKDEEEAQDSFTAEFRKMKLRGEFPCKLCTAVFPNLRALKGHNRIHISAAGNAGPFRCNMCLYSIHDKAALVRHMRTHNGDRPYECAVCNYAFTTKANCERHLRNRHSKTTREEVKRAIIYHPSEDSSCDDPTKKLHLFSSPEFDNDDELQINPKDCSTPVPISHLKEILQSESTISKPSVKIQVKSLEKLIDKTVSSASTAAASSSSLPIIQTNNFPSTTVNLSRYESENLHQISNSSTEKQQQDLDDSTDSHHNECVRAIDLSMDVLDLSKKSKPVPEEVLSPKIQQDILSDALKLDLPQQFLLAQQQFFAEALPKMDAANYFQLCRNLPLPFNPFFAFNPLLSNGLDDFSKFTPFMNSAPLFGNPSNLVPGLNVPSAPSTNGNNINNGQIQRISPQDQSQNIEKVHTENSSNNIVNSGTSSSGRLLPKTLQSPPITNTGNQMNLSGTQNISQAQRLPLQQQLQTTPLNQSVNNNGPVKMVIKNGVLMPKQKQRRYRTERPFACEHCSARFTLRSNMERHIKQQHPQFWAQRQRSGQHVMRGRGSSSNVMSHMQSSHLRAQVPNSLPSNHFGTISDQVKYALLAQQLKARKETDILQQALTQGSNGTPYNNNNSHSNHNNNNGSLEDDDNDPKLIIDEDDDLEEVEDQDDPQDDYDEDENCNVEDDEQDEDNEINFKETLKQEDHNASESIIGAKKVAETILEQAIKAGSSAVNKQLPSNEDSLKIANNMIARAESVGKYLKEVASSSFKSDESSPDLVSVSKLVDNATNNAMTFKNYFKPNDISESTNNVNHMEQSDEEGLVASGSASDNNSGAEESANNTNSGQQKKKSAYSLAPNRVPCPYCDRIFPWSSSLRRHILTHTGQKPFKCSHCPLLFTTKSNCDRHLLRKHGNVESAVSLYVPIDDMPDPVPMPKAVAEAFQAAKAAAASVAASTNITSTSIPQIQLQQQQHPTHLLQKNQNESETHSEHLKGLLQNPAQITLPKPGVLVEQQQQTILQISSTDLPFKCHLCDSSFSERMQCLDHIKMNHIQEFALLLAKGAIDTEIDPNCTQLQHSATEEDDKRDDGRGKYPDYANRKVICAFCVRRFWSTEDLRRHMRTHSGERPFQCEVCLRKFTLKHSMLRHMKKHNGGNHNNQMTTQNSGSDCSDDEQPSASMILVNSLRNHKIHELLSKVGGNGNDWHSSNNQILLNRGENDLSGGAGGFGNTIKSETINNELLNLNVSASTTLGGANHNNNNNGTNNNSDLIGNLLGISDQSLLNKFLTNPSEAAKFFGVEK